MSDVEPEDSGLASGVVNTSFMMGGALGLAVLASLAAARSSSLAEAGADALAALNGGYHLAFLVGAVAAAVAGVLGGMLLRIDAPAMSYDGSPAGSVDAAGDVADDVADDGPDDLDDDDPRLVTADC